MWNKNEIISKVKQEIIFSYQSRKNNKNIWSVIPGKFTLAFSIAPEFYRLVYKKIQKIFDTG